MSEHLPTPEHKERQFYGKTWDQWHELCVEFDDRSPATTVYGDTADERAWWSVAAMSVILPQLAEEHGAERVNPDILSRLIAGHVRHGRPQIGEHVIEYLSDVPREVAEHLVTPRGGDGE